MTPTAVHHAFVNGILAELNGRSDVTLAIVSASINAALMRLSPANQDALIDILRPMTTKFAAYLTGLDYHTLENKRVQGKGPAYTKGDGPRGAVRYELAAIILYRLLQARASTSAIS